MSFELVVLACLVILAVLFVLRFAHRYYRYRTSVYYKGSVEEAMEAFRSNTGPLLLQLEPPFDCDSAAEVLKSLKIHYMHLLRRANRYPDHSEEYRKIFSGVLQPVLDKISYVSSYRECFKNPEFKKAFDQFIKTIQKQGKHSGEST